MSREMVDRCAAALPGAVRSRREDGELDGWKIGGRIFACHAMRGDGVTVKCPDAGTAEMLIEAGEGLKARYFHRSWLLLPYEGMREAAVAHRLAVSYDAVRAGLPKSVRAALPSTVPRRPD